MPQKSSEQHWFTEPVFHRPIPRRRAGRLRKEMPAIGPDDMAVNQSAARFLRFQSLFRMKVKAGADGRVESENHHQGQPITAIYWPVTPDRSTGAQSFSTTL